MNGSFFSQGAGVIAILDEQRSDYAFFAADKIKVAKFEEPPSVLFIWAGFQLKILVGVIFRFKFKNLINNLRRRHFFLVIQNCYTLRKCKFCGESAMICVSLRAYISVLVIIYGL